MRKTTTVFIFLLLAVMSCAPAFAADRVTAFSFSTNGASIADVSEFVLHQESSRPVLEVKYQNYSKNVDIMCRPDTAVVAAISRLIKKHRLDMWNGFNKRDEGVLDGSGFSLYVRLASGKTVNASGYGRFPKGYDNFVKDLMKLRSAVAAKYGRRP